MRTAQRTALIGSAFCILATTAPAAAQGRDISRCFAIADVNQRVECFEGRSSGSPSDPSASPQPLRANPSFDCRSASHPVEHVICSDSQLAELDARMGALFQQIARQRNRDPAVIDNQRIWLGERERICGAQNSQTIGLCLQRSTMARIATLSSALNPQTGASAPPPPVTPQPPSSPRTEVVTQQADPPATSDPAKANSNTDGAGVFIGLLVSVTSLVFLRKWLRYRRRRKMLVGKYGEWAAVRILRQEVWKGMTKEQLLESLGSPSDYRQELKKTIMRETYKYGQTGKNRFDKWVILDNGIVSMWKQ